MNSQKSVTDFKDFQILFFVAKHKDKTAKEIASMLDIYTDKVYTTVKKYNTYGVSWKKACNPRGGRREARCLTSLEEEKSFLLSIEKEALKGEILTYRHVLAKLETKFGKSVSEDYVWDMFNRHGWSKKVPGKIHPQSDIAAREEFKKNSRSYWSPNR
jgi:transposase